MLVSWSFVAFPVDKGHLTSGLYANTQLPLLLKMFAQ